MPPVALASFGVLPPSLDDRAARDGMFGNALCIVGLQEWIFSHHGCVLSCR